ncbi:hypothetical protein Hypma_000672 [Hypsizygus marmoreus]|uniref:Uncharacterized protein n=1 Tax=Hypsizygus marmoreus TaxID=39966 RepID=A0A369J796_HYPMA|nr:hypothetical protein Hypma_000672 [Hypsizygus marmoreus]
MSTFTAIQDDPSEDPAGACAPFTYESPSASPLAPALPEKRVRKLTEKVMAMLGDTLPEGPGPLVPEEPVEQELLPVTLRIRIRQAIKTVFNSFSLQRTYYGRPSRIPDAEVGFGEFIADDFRRKGTAHRHPSATPEARFEEDIISPYPNTSAFLFNRWFWNGANKTKESRKDLLKNVLLSDRFDPEDLRDVNFDRLDDELAQNPGAASDGNGWDSDTVHIDVPTGKKETKASRKAAAARRRRFHDSDSEEEAAAMDSEPSASRRFAVPGLHHRKLCDLVVEVFSGADTDELHMHPYEEHWQPPWNDATTERVHGEFYTSRAFLEADRELYNSPPEPDCDLLHVIAAIMLYSDSTHVAQFGQAKLWPAYTFIGNQSKYV